MPSRASLLLSRVCFATRCASVLIGRLTALVPATTPAPPANRTFSFDMVHPLVSQAWHPRLTRRTKCSFVWHFLQTIRFQRHRRWRCSERLLEEWPNMKPLRELRGSPEFEVREIRLRLLHGRMQPGILCVQTPGVQVSISTVAAWRNE